jgi:hypothetical protein
MAMLIVITPQNIQAIRRADPPTLEEMQKLVGGYVELITNYGVWDEQGPHPAQIYCNEDGKRLELPANPLATEYVRILFPHFNDLLVGTVVVLTDETRWT